MTYTVSVLFINVFRKEMEEEKKRNKKGEKRNAKREQTTLVVVIEDVEPTVNAT